MTRERLARSAYARQETRAALEELGPPPGRGPGAGPLIASLLGVLTAPCAVLADYFLFAAPVEYIASLASTAPSIGARLLVPVAICTIEVAVSVRRALRRYGAVEEGRGTPWSLVLLAILSLQVLAAGAQYLALEAATPSPANGVLLGFLGLLAVVTHAATLLLAGESILLLATAGAHARHRRAHARLSRRLRKETRALVARYQAWNERRADGEPRALDPVVIAELHLLLGEPEQAVPQPADPASAEPPNPYEQVDWSDDQCL